MVIFDIPVSPRTVFNPGRCANRPSTDQRAPGEASQAQRERRPTRSHAESKIKPFPMSKRVVRVLVMHPSSWSTARIRLDKSERLLFSIEFANPTWLSSRKQDASEVSWQTYCQNPISTKSQLIHRQDPCGVGNGCSRQNLSSARVKSLLWKDTDVHGMGNDLFSTWIKYEMREEKHWFGI